MTPPHYPLWFSYTLSASVSIVLFIFLFLVITVLILAVLGLRCSTQAFSSSHAKAFLFAVSGLVALCCGILVLWQGIKPMFPALEHGFLSTGPSGKFPIVLFENSPRITQMCYTLHFLPEFSLLQLPVYLLLVKCVYRYVCFRKLYNVMISCMKILRNLKFLLYSGLDRKSNQLCITIIIQLSVLLLLYS